MRRLPIVAIPDVPVSSVDGRPPVVIQGSKMEPETMRYELNDYEWRVIKPMLPNKPRGVP